MTFPQGEADDQEYPCLLRATDGGEAKFSTHVRGITLKTYF